MSDKLEANHFPRRGVGTGPLQHSCGSHDRGRSIDSGSGDGFDEGSEAVEGP